MVMITWGLLDVGQHVFRYQVAVLVVVLGVVGYESAQSVPDGDAGGYEQEPFGEPVFFGGSWTALTVCHAISMAITVVLPAPVASFRARTEEFWVGALVAALQVVSDCFESAARVRAGL